MQAFESTNNFNVNIAGWNVASVTTLFMTFKLATGFDQDLGIWNVLRVTSASGQMGHVFGDPAGQVYLSNCNKVAVYGAWGATLRAQYPTWGGMATCGTGLCGTCITNANIATAVTAWVTSPTTAVGTYGGPIGDWDVSAVSNMHTLFYNKPTFNSDVSKWNVASVTAMVSSFNLATEFNQDIGAWNVASVSNM